MASEHLRREAGLPLDTVRRAAISAAVILASLTCGTALARAATPPSCVTPEVRQHGEVVFGHFSTHAQAAALAHKAAPFGFKGIKIENEGCGDFEVEIDGADRAADRVSFAAEAQKAGFPITFEQTGPPLVPPKGEVVGIFAKFPTIEAANALALRLAGTGFRYIDIVKLGNRWAVVMPQVPVKNALPIAAEVHKAGFTIHFVSASG
jgi:hypothetical protein